METTEKKKPSPMMKLATSTETLADAIEDFGLITTPNMPAEIISDITRQLGNTSRELRAVARRLRRIDKLLNNPADKYVVLDPSGDLRPATADEILRLVMKYPPAGVGMVELLRLDRKGETPPEFQA